MKHADRLIERILFLEGLPNLQNLGKLLIGENAAGGAAVRPQAGTWPRIRTSRTAIAALRSDAATTSAASCSSDILESEEEHIDWLETQLGLIATLGETNYLQTKLHG